ncbi:chitin deacetylase [Pseudaminobacter arsenicus]|uniref:Chitooligosaccharide deacetylase n=1 Tax=Borborobacter arsenicus TaxID=1851146 RepID=A0A432V1T0_9HYPH|nr:polysaccharide deacetylase family protein [Pseudaminobacter arsenicus]RUM96012.1 chitin deacetylase [Pseudaminobacter arsenicus]
MIDKQGQSGPARDFVGYGQRPPQANWPAGARIAVQFVVNYEEGSEYAIPDGDPASERGLLETVSAVPDGVRDLAAESLYEYGSRVGVWRLLDLFDTRDIPITLFACAVAVERNPELAAYLRSASHEVCCHGLRWERHWLLSEAEERDHIARAVALLERTVGRRPLGWYCRYGPSIHTRRLLREEGGFVYDSDAYNDELPYWDREPGRPHLVIPYTHDANDAKLINPIGLGSVSAYFEYLRNTFDVLYREGGSTPKMMSIGLHARLARPGRLPALEAFLDHIARHDRVWIARRIDIARHWSAHHPRIDAGVPS